MEKLNREEVVVTPRPNLHSYESIAVAITTDPGPGEVHQETWCFVTFTKIHGNYLVMPDLLQITGYNPNFYSPGNLLFILVLAM